MEAGVENITVLCLCKRSELVPAATLQGWLGRNKSCSALLPSGVFTLRTRRKGISFHIEVIIIQWPITSIGDRDETVK